MSVGEIFNRLFLVLTLVFTGLRVMHCDSLLTPRALNTAAAVTFQLSSPAFLDRAAIPSHYTCDGANRAPALQWKGASTGTHSLALIMDDPDAPGGTFTHWVLFNIPGILDRLPEGIRPQQVGVSGQNDFGKLAYGGPCPPSGVHRYLFTLHALDAPSLSLSKGVLRRQVEQAMQGHILGQAQLMGRYGRK